MSQKANKVLFMAKQGPDHPEKATLPFAVAVGAMASDLETVVLLQSDAVLLALRGVADHVFAPGMTPLKDLVNEFLESGGTLLVCSTCLTARKIDATEIIEGASISSVSRLAKELTEAINVVSY